MLDSPPTCHKHGFLIGYKRVVRSIGGPGFDSSLKHFFHICRQLFSILKNSTFSFLTCYRDACGYIKKVWIVDNAINTLFGVHLYGFVIVDMEWQN